MKHMEELNRLFGDAAFLEKNKDCSDYESIYAAVKAEAPEVTMDELKAYLEMVSKAMHTDGEELDETVLDEVAGGDPGLTVWVAIKAISGCYAIGVGIGKFAYYITHR